MSTLIKLALRNTFRNRRRTFITIIVIACGTAAIVFMGGFVDDMYEGLRHWVIHGEYGHLQIYKKGFMEKGSTNPFQYLIDNYAELDELIKSVEHVSYTTPRILFPAMVFKGDSTSSVLLLGVNPSGESQLSKIPPDSKYAYLGERIYTLEGKDLKDSEPKGAIIGQGLASALDLKVGEEITIITTTHGGSINGMDVKVSGIFWIGSKEYDNVLIKLPIKTVRKLLNIGCGVQQIVVVLDDDKYTEIVKQKLLSLFRKKKLPLELKTWVELSDFYRAVVSFLDTFFYAISIVIYLTVAIAIVNTMMMAVFERTREIGIMMAMGRKQKEILLLFLIEGLIIGIMGGGIGIIFGIIICKIVSAIGIPMAPPPGFTKAFIRRANIVPSVLIFAFSLSVISSVLSALYPAIKATRLKVIEALRYE